jgi:hypothetical protein
MNVPQYSFDLSVSGHMPPDPKAIANAERFELPEDSCPVVSPGSEVVRRRQHAPMQGSRRRGRAVADDGKRPRWSRG